VNGLTIGGKRGDLLSLTRKFRNMSALMKRDQLECLPITSRTSTMTFNFMNIQNIIHISSEWAEPAR
jgi:hypothetical protein